MTKKRLWLGALVAVWMMSTGCCRFADRWCRDDRCSNPCYAPPAFSAPRSQCIAPQDIPPPPANYCPPR